VESRTGEPFDNCSGQAGEKRYSMLDVGFKMLVAG
jgi:hypothetical protein